MDLESLLLRKEEIPITEIPDHDGNPRPHFFLPIHPSLVGSDEQHLVRPGVSLGHGIARRIFSDVASDWYDDLTDYRKSLDASHRFLSGERLDRYKKWIDSVYLAERAWVEKRSYKQVVMPMGTWQDHVHILDNGFVQDFMINRDYGGSLYVSWNSHERIQSFAGSQVKFTGEKFSEYAAEDDFGRTGSNVFLSHNMDYYPGGLFLRNWAMRWHNEALKELYGKVH